MLDNIRRESGNERLQRNFEASVSQIQMLERRKTSAATAYAIILGVVGTAFMAGSTLAVTEQPEKITPLIEEKYDEIYEICEKGNKLLY